jgi:hypothetical protein
VGLFTQKKMDKSTNKNISFFNRIKRVTKWVWRWMYIILAASMIGFSNAYYDECRMVNDIRNKVQQEQVFDDEDTNEKEQPPTLTIK